MIEKSRKRNILISLICLSIIITALCACYSFGFRLYEHYPASTYVYILLGMPFIGIGFIIYLLVSLFRKEPNREYFKPEGKQWPYYLANAVFVSAMVATFMAMMQSLQPFFMLDFFAGAVFLFEACLIPFRYRWFYRIQGFQGKAVGKMVLVCFGSALVQTFFFAFLFHLAFNFFLNVHNNAHVWTIIIFSFVLYAAASFASLVLRNRYGYIFLPCQNQEKNGLD